MGAIKLDFKGGDDGFGEITNLSIEVMDNGFVLYFSNEEEDFKEVYASNHGLLARIRELL